MAKKLKTAIEQNARAAKELENALRECISAIRDAPDNVVEGRFRLVTNRRQLSSGG